jgi:hypothetical protein
MPNSSPQSVEVASSLFGGLRKQQQSIAQGGIGRLCGLSAASNDLGLHPCEGFNFVVFHGQTLPRISDAFNCWQPDRERRMGESALRGKMDGLRANLKNETPRSAGRRNRAVCRM